MEASVQQATKEMYAGVMFSCVAYVYAYVFKRRHFNPEPKLDIVFVDGNCEGTVDEGGLTRDYLRRLMRAIHETNIFEKNRQLCLDTQALQTKLYTLVAKMIAVCVVHGGVGPHFFSERLFQQICGTPTPPTIVDEVGDHTFREQLIKIQEATMANSAIAEAVDSLSIIGALRHMSSLEEKDSLVQSAADFFVCLGGLRPLGLLEELRKNPAVFYDVFVNEEMPLQAKDLCTPFEVEFFVQGSNRRARENMNICFWRDWLIEIDTISIYTISNNVMYFISTMICGHVLISVCQSPRQSPKMSCFVVLSTTQSYSSLLSYRTKETRKYSHLRS